MNSCREWALMDASPTLTQGEVDGRSLLGWGVERERERESDRMELVPDINFVNHYRVAGVLGYLPQDLIGQMSYEYYHPDDIQKMVHLHHDGKYVPFPNLHSPILIPEHMLIYIVLKLHSYNTCTVHAYMYMYMHVNTFTFTHLQYRSDAT